jgi:hypothetical protein
MTKMINDQGLARYDVCRLAVSTLELLSQDSGIQLVGLD